MKKFLILLTLILTSVFFSACNDKDEATTVIEDNTSFKDLKVLSNKNYTLQTIDNKELKFKVENNELTSKQLNGKYVLINFWATWCAPCVEEIPTLVNFYSNYKDKFVVIGVLMEKDKDLDELGLFMEKMKMNFPITTGAENFRIAKAFDDVKMFPESFLFAPDGKFIKKYIGVIDPNDLKAYLEK